MTNCLNQKNKFQMAWSRIVRIWLPPEDRSSPIDHHLPSAQVNALAIIQLRFVVSLDKTNQQKDASVLNIRHTALYMSFILSCPKTWICSHLKYMVFCEWCIQIVILSLVHRYLTNPIVLYANIFYEQLWSVIEFKTIDFLISFLSGTDTLIIILL